MSGKYVAFVECNASGTGAEAMQRVRERGLSVILLTQEREFYGTLESNPLEHADVVIDVCMTCVGSMLNRLCEYSLCGVLAFDDYRRGGGPFSATGISRQGRRHTGLSI